MTKQPQSWGEWVAAHNSLPRMEIDAGSTPAPTTTAFAQSPLAVGHFDPLELLPEGAAEKLRLLRERSSERRDAMIPHAELQEAIAERTRAEQHLRRLQAHPQDHGLGLPPEHASCIAAEKEIARTSEAARRLQERSERLAQAWRAAAEPLAACETWPRDGRPSGVQLQDYDGPEPKLNKGEANLLDAIANRQRRVRELKADLHRIASAPFPSAYCKQRLRQIVEQAAAHGAPDVSGLVELDQEDVRWPQKRVRSEVLGTQGALAFHEAVDLVGLLAFLLKPTLISALDALVDAEQDDPAALTHEQRQKAEAEAQNDLLATERDICALIWRGQAVPLEFPADISPIALLGLRLVTPPRADGLPGTTPGLSWELLR